MGGRVCGGRARGLGRLVGFRARAARARVAEDARDRSGLQVWHVIVAASRDARAIGADGVVRPGAGKVAATPVPRTFGALTRGRGGAGSRFRAASHMVRGGTGGREGGGGVEGGGLATGARRTLVCRSPGRFRRDWSVARGSPGHGRRGVSVAVRSRRPVIRRRRRRSCSRSRCVGRGGEGGVESRSPSLRLALSRTLTHARARFWRSGSKGGRTRSWRTSARACTVSGRWGG